VIRIHTGEIRVCMTGNETCRPVGGRRGPVPFPTTIDAPKRSASAIVKNCPDSMKDWSGAAGLGVVGRPIFSKHFLRRPLFR
jgi:hypothetical protein